MAIEASRQNAGVMNYARRGSHGGTPITDGGMKTHIAGTRNAIGMTVITNTTATTTESLVPLRLGAVCTPRSQPTCYWTAEGGCRYANKNSFVRNSLIASRSLAAFSNSKRFAASRMSLSNFPM